MNSIYLNNFKNNFNEYFEIQNDIHEDLTTILYSNSEFMIDCYIHHNLIRIFGDNISTVKQIISDELQYLMNPNYIVFDFGKSDTKAIIALIQSKLANKLIFNGRILIIIKNIHLINNSSQSILSNILDTRNDHYYFLLTSINLTRIISGITSKCLCRKIFLGKMTKTLKLFCKNEDLDDSKVSKIAKNTSDIYTALTVLSEGITYVNLMENQLTQIFKLIKKQKHEHFIFNVRECIYKLSLYNIPNNQICHSIVTIVTKKFKSHKNIHNIISYIAKTQHNLIFASRHLYHFELLFIYIYQNINH